MYSVTSVTNHLFSFSTLILPGHLHQFTHTNQLINKIENFPSNPYEAHFVLNMKMQALLWKQ